MLNVNSLNSTDCRTMFWNVWNHLASFMLHWYCKLCLSIIITVLSGSLNKTFSLFIAAYISFFPPSYSDKHVSIHFHRLRINSVWNDWKNRKNKLYCLLMFSHILQIIFPCCAVVLTHRPIVLQILKLITMFQDDQISFSRL